MITRFGSLGAALAADLAAMKRITPPGSPVPAFLASIRQAVLHSLRREALDGPILSTSAALADYLHASLAPAFSEHFRVLFLDARNRLIREQTFAIGSPTATTVYPREIMCRALELGASGLILVHNHPSGDPRPSRDDIETTRLISAAARPLDIRVHDHVIVARSGRSSFKKMGLLDATR